MKARKLVSYLLASCIILTGVGCITTVYTQAPPCPLWTEQAIEDLEHMQTLGLYDDLEEAIGRQELFCHALEPEPDQCVGWACWWWRLWN